MNGKREDGLLLLMGLLGNSACCVLRVA